MLMHASRTLMARIW